MGSEEVDRPDRLDFPFGYQNRFPAIRAVDMNNDLPEPRLDFDGLNAFLDAAFPLEARANLGSLVEIAPGRVRMLLEPTAAMARPGGIVSGPSLMALADIAAYAAIAAHYGPEPMAVTHNLSISFLSFFSFFNNFRCRALSSSISCSNLSISLLCFFSFFILRACRRTPLSR